MTPKKKQKKKRVVTASVATRTDRASPNASSSAIGDVKPIQTATHHGVQGQSGETSPGETTRRRIRGIEDPWTVALGAAVTLAALVLYVLTAAHDVMGGDTPEFLIAAKTLGVAHAPGYPLLTMVGYLFSWLPIGSIPFRIGLLAVVSSTATVALVYATVWKLTLQRLPSAAAGLALACTPLFWRWSLQAEVFPLNNFLIALTIFLLVCWHQRPSDRWPLVSAVFTFSLAVTNQQTSVFVLPAIIWILWLHRDQLRSDRRLVLYSLVAVIVGFLPYVYVPIAALGNSPTNWDYVHSLSAFARLLFRSDYGGLTSQGGGAPTGSNLIVRVAYLARGLGLIVGIISVFGALQAYRTLRWYFWFVVIAVASSGIGFLLLTQVDPSDPIGLYVLERFFLLPLVIIAPLVGLGVVWISAFLVAHWPSVASRTAVPFVTLAVVLTSAIVVGVNYSTVNVSNDRVTGNYARNVLEGLKPHAILFASGDEGATATLYMNTVEGIRRDVTVIWAQLLDTRWYVQVLRHNDEIHVPLRVTTLSIIRANTNRPIAFTGPAPDDSINGTYYLYPVGLTSELKKVGHPILATVDEAENEAQLGRVQVPNYKSIKPDSPESVVLDHYANIPYRIGQAYALAGNRTEAINWYRKAEAMDPSLPLASQAIRKLGGTP